MASDDIVRFVGCKHSTDIAYPQNPTLEPDDLTITKPPCCLPCTLEIDKRKVRTIMHFFDAKYVKSSTRQIDSPCNASHGWPSMARHRNAFDSLLSRVEYGRNRRDTEVAEIWDAVIHEWDGAREAYWQAPYLNGKQSRWETLSMSTTYRLAYGAMDFECLKWEWKWKRNALGDVVDKGVFGRKGFVPTRWSDEE